MRPGQLARLIGVSPDTVRHYERLGLLPRPPRTRSGYRDYPPESVERVRLIRRALRVGFSLPELKTILCIRDRGGVPCQRVRVMAKFKLQQVKQQMKDLLVMRAQLDRIVRDWDARLARTRKGQRAQLLEHLPDDLMRCAQPTSLNVQKQDQGRKKVSYANNSSSGSSRHRTGYSRSAERYATKPR